MQIILLDQIENLGGIGDQVKVRRGYARNFLIPQGKAIPLTRDNLSMVEKTRAELQVRVQQRLTEAEKRAEVLKALPNIVMTANVSESGELYGSVGPREIIEALKKCDIEVDRRDVLLAEGPLRSIGEHEVQIRFHSECIVPLKVVVNA